MVNQKQAKIPKALLFTMSLMAFGVVGQTAKCQEQVFDSRGKLVGPLLAQDVLVFKPKQTPVVIGFNANGFIQVNAQVVRAITESW